MTFFAACFNRPGDRDFCLIRRPRPEALARTSPDLFFSVLGCVCTGLFMETDVMPICRLYSRISSLINKLGSGLNWS
ncbi:hypothetical protein LIPSTDRAFT_216212 [Lipomyces starkeyi NRRL Y-11557]|uniref:Uncharacterized protein n=1 Tax=Lipomyces starkeyi NRRL Y-11557 TaxID=675824 RepID=A0A1E3QDK0_LIPST|nr:hypothetical protein LIPSTDRAFT_216212 [Lipomyces starkeyi NRRL Y-11557]